MWKLDLNLFDQFMYKQLYRELFDSDKHIKDRFNLSIMIFYLIRSFVRLLYSNYFGLFNQKEYFFFEHVNECFFNNDPIFSLVAQFLTFLGIFICIFYKIDDTFYNKQMFHSLFDIIVTSIEDGDNTDSPKIIFPERTRYFDHFPKKIWSKILFIEKFFEQLSFGSYLFFRKYSI